jgi:phosphopantetheine--protein transferase-like protein
MIIGIGVDQVAVKRFYNWHIIYATQLHKIFSAAEIDYCMGATSEQQRAERFAVRFAAREAFFKAFTTACITVYKRPGPTLMHVLPNVTIERIAKGIPVATINWDRLLEPNDVRPKVHLSLTHTDDIAGAFVILEQV